MISSMPMKSSRIVTIQTSGTVSRNGSTSTSDPRSAQSEPKMASSQLHCDPVVGKAVARSEEHTSELQSLMRISYAVFCLKKQTIIQNNVYMFKIANINQ